MTELPQGASLLQILEIGATLGPLNSLSGAAMNEFSYTEPLEERRSKDKELDLFWWLIHQTGWPRPGQPTWVSGITREQYRVALDIYKEMINV